MIDGGNARAQADAVANPKQVVAGDVERNTGREAGGAGGSIEAIVASTDTANLCSGADGDRIAAGLFHLVEDVLVVGIAIGVLNGGVDAGEDAKVVEAPLGFGDLGGERGSPGFRVRLRLTRL